MTASRNTNLWTLSWALTPASGPRIHCGKPWRADGTRYEYVRPAPVAILSVAQMVAASAAVPASTAGTWIAPRSRVEARRGGLDDLEAIATLARFDAALDSAYDRSRC